MTSDRTLITTNGPVQGRCCFGDQPLVHSSVNYLVVFSQLYTHPVRLVWLIINSVTFLTAGAPILTVTQQTPTSPQGEAEKEMSKTVTACLKFTVVCLAAHSWLFLYSWQVNHLTPSPSPTTPPLVDPLRNLLWFTV